jgi:hypothetical protein
MMSKDYLDKWEERAKKNTEIIEQTKTKLLCEDCNKANRYLMFRVCEPCLINGKYLTK